MNRIFRWWSGPLHAPGGRRNRNGPCNSAAALCHDHEGTQPMAAIPLLDLNPPPGTRVLINGAAVQPILRDWLAKIPVTRGARVDVDSVSFL